MRILAFETSTSVGTVATLESGQLLGQVELPRGQRTAQTLAPAIVEQLATVGWKPRQIELVATTRGPGSFTGIRIAVTTAKTLAYASRGQILGVDTLEVIATQYPGTDERLDVILDAQRQQLIAATYCRDTSGRWLPDGSRAIVDIDSWIAQLDPQVLVTGPGLSRVVDRLPSGVRTVGREHWTPQAKTVGQLACEHFQRGRRDDLWQLVPDYCRKSAAEEKWERRTKDEG